MEKLLNKKNTLVISVFFLQVKIENRLIYEFIESIAPAKIDYIGYSYLSNNKFVNKEYKYKGDLSKSKFLELGNINLDSFGFTTYESQLKNIITYSIDYSTDISISQYNLIQMSLPLDFFENLESVKNYTKKYISIISEFINKHKSKLIYGFVYAMSNDNYPTLISTAIGNYDSSEIEKKELENWSYNQEKMGTRIWRLFWGNLITKNHLVNNTDFYKIQEIVGIENTYFLDSNSALFFLPSDNILYMEEDKNITSKIFTYVNRMG